MGKALLIFIWFIFVLRLEYRNNKTQRGYEKEVQIVQVLYCESTQRALLGYLTSTTTNS